MIDYFRNSVIHYLYHRRLTSNINLSKLKEDVTCHWI